MKKLILHIPVVLITDQPSAQMLEILDLLKKNGYESKVKENYVYAISKQVEDLLLNVELDVDTHMAELESYIQVDKTNCSNPEEAVSVIVTRIVSYAKNMYKGGLS